jgi:hypothetical protein
MHTGKGTGAAGAAYGPHGMNQTSHNPYMGGKPPPKGGGKGQQQGKKKGNKP